MRNRGQIYWNWADPALHSRDYDERLSSGTVLNIQVRLSKTSQTQLFVGVYGQSGLLLFEDSYLERPGQSMSQALLWGLALAREKAEQSSSLSSGMTKGRRQRSF